MFETHSISEDNERNAASGLGSQLPSARGRELPRRLGERRRGDAIAAVFSSDLRRAAETAAEVRSVDLECQCCWIGDSGSVTTEIAMPVPPAEHVRDPRCSSTRPTRVGRAGGKPSHGRARLEDLPPRWQDQRVLVIGHVATRWALDHYVTGTPLETLIAGDFAWQEGWEYTLDETTSLSAP